MRLLRLKQNDDDYARRYPDDVKQIRRALANAGYAIDGATAAEAWNRYCERTFAAGWLDLPDDDWWIVQAILEETE